MLNSGCASDSTFQIQQQGRQTVIYTDNYLSYLFLHMHEYKIYPSLSRDKIVSSPKTRTRNLGETEVVFATHKTLKYFKIVS